MSEEQERLLDASSDDNLLSDIEYAVDLFFKYFF